MASAARSFKAGRHDALVELGFEPVICAAMSDVRSVHLCRRSAAAADADAASAAPSAVVAVKALSRGASTAAIAGLMRERDALLALRGAPAAVAAHVAGLAETRRDGAAAYLVLRAGVGGPLHRHVRAQRGGRLPAAAARAYAAQLSLALGHCHALGVVHRDVKASNVLLDGRGHALLGDFGCASPPGGARLTFCGTPHAMAPETVEARDLQREARTPVGPAVDWWALGVLWREMALGRPPFGYGADKDGGHEALYRKIRAYAAPGAKGEAAAAEALADAMDCADDDAATRALLAPCPDARPDAAALRGHAALAGAPWAALEGRTGVLEPRPEGWTEFFDFEDDAAKEVWASGFELPD